MASQSIACPGCKARLKVREDRPADKAILCPSCATTFTLSEVLAEPFAPEAATPKPTSSFMIGAILGGIALSVVGIALTISLMQHRTVQTVEVKPPPPVEAPRQLELKGQPNPLDKAQANEAELTKLLLAGSEALREKHYAQAKDAYLQALKLAPENLKANKGLDEAVAGLTQVKPGVGPDPKPEPVKLDPPASIEKMLEQANLAMTAKEYTKAKVLYELVLQKKPDEAAALAGLKEADRALTQVPLDKKKEEFKVALDLGKQHLLAQRYVEALREYTTALRLMPDDADALKGKQQAERGLNDAEKEKFRKDQHAKLMDQGTTALRNRFFTAAITAFTEATQLVNDRVTQQALSDAKTKFAEAQREAQRLLDRGDLASGNNQFDLAEMYYRQAQEALPGYELATKKLEQARVRRDEIEKLLLTYNRAMQVGTLAMNAKRYADAVTAFAQAVQILPNDVQATQAYKEAKKLYDEQVLLVKEYEKQMQAGKQALAQKKYLDAVKAFEEALKLVPNDLTAQLGLKQAKEEVKKTKYKEYLLAGQAAMLQKKYPEAIKQFELALAEQPGDVIATAHLVQAKNLANKK